MKKEKSLFLAKRRKVAKYSERAVYLKKVNIGYNEKGKMSFLREARGR